MMFPRVSVIIIFLNGEPFLEEAISSVLVQDFQDFELLLVDDGSTDASTSRAKAHAARSGGKIRYLEHPGHANRGMSATRNLGLSHAASDLIAFIDADDVWEPNKLAEQVALMDAHPELGMVCGTVRYWSSWSGGADRTVISGALQGRVLEPPAASLSTYPLGAGKAACPSDMLLRRSTLEAVGGFEEHFTGPRQMYEDQAFLAKLYLVAPVYFSTRLWLNYRQHPDSCVAQVRRDGRYEEVRQYFFRWLEDYVTRDGANVDPRVVKAIGRTQLAWKFRSIVEPYLHLRGFIHRARLGLVSLLSPRDGAARDT